MAFFDDDNLQNGQLGGPTAAPPVQPGPQAPPMPQPAAPMPAPQPPVAPPQAAPLPVPGANATVRYSPAQAVGAQQALGQQGQDLELKGGAAESEGQDKIAAEEARRAAEIAQTKIDEANAQKAAEEKWNAAHNKHVDMFNKYAEKAGSLKDPSTQFWEDKGQGAHIGAALAGFVSGAGAGFNHQQDPFIGYLNDRIKGNYEAHRQNIEDLYKASVESGKIADTVENHNKFNQDARLALTKFGELQTDHELKRYAAETNSKVMKVKALQAANTIVGQGVQRGAQLVHDETALAVQQAGLQRAQTKEDQATFLGLVAKHSANLPEDQARIEALKDMAASGINRSRLAPFAERNGVTTDPKTGDFVFPESKKSESSSTEASFDANGNLQIPTVDSNGHRLKPEQMDKMREEAQKRTVLVDGKPMLAVSDKAAEKFQVHTEIMPDIIATTKRLKDAWESGDQGTYEGARNHLIEIAPQLYGYTRGPSGAQAGETGAASKEADEAKGTVAGQLPEWGKRDALANIKGVAGAVNRNLPDVPVIGANSSPGQAKTKLAEWEAGIQSTHESLLKGTFAHPPESAKPAASPADLAKQFGGKPVK